MRKTSRLLIWSLLMAAIVSVALGAAELKRLEPLSADGYLYVSFELVDVLTDDVWAAIRSGLTTTFTFDVELRHNRLIWFDRSVRSAVVAASVRYDNLTRRYFVSRTHDGRVDESLWIHGEADVRGWMTSFKRLRLFPTVGLVPDGGYYVRVRVRTRPRDTLLFFLPWDRGAASARAVLRLGS